MKIKYLFRTLNYDYKYTLKKFLFFKKERMKSFERDNGRILNYLKKYLSVISGDYDLELENLGLEIAADGIDTGANRKINRDHGNCDDNHDNNIINFVDNPPIWQLWLQGEDEMPPIVRFCVNSIRKCNPDRNIILLTEKNLNDYVSLPKYVEDKYKNGILTPTHYSDIIRLYLLYSYGGTWIDATVYMSGTMPEFITNAPLFVFKDLTGCRVKKDTTLEEFRIMNDVMNFGAFTNSISFFHSSAKGSEMIGNTLRILLAYWEKENEAIDYLLFSYILTLVIFSNQKFKEQFIKIPDTLTTVEYGILQQCLYESYDEKLFDIIKGMTSIHKLTYKHQEFNILKDSFLNHFLRENE